MTRRQVNWNESAIQKRVAQVRAVFEKHGHGGRRLALYLQRLRDHLIAIAKSAHIERCSVHRVVTDHEGNTRAGDPCGGRIRQRRVRLNGALFVERFCDACGRADAPVPAPGGAE